MSLLESWSAKVLDQQAKTWADPGIHPLVASHTFVKPRD